MGHVSSTALSYEGVENGFLGHDEHMVDRTMTMSSIIVKNLGCE